MQSSIIIPVFNKWELTRDCLHALGATLPRGCCEIIVIDNASSDETATACKPLGEALFGAAFRYLRSEANLNFGPASNLGAREASGEFLIFLNNDTIPKPGWYEPLLKDFSLYPDIAASGPLLLYPPAGPLGETVQHLGVFVSPEIRVGHLYDAIPAASRLAKKRRFFQIITAACMAVPRKLFLAFNGFDEGFVNGCEDVDLCARLWEAGYRMTVNAESEVVHLAGQTPGRHAHEAANLRHLTETSLKLLTPDWHLHLANDGFRPGVNHWLSYYVEDAGQLAVLPPSRVLTGPQGKSALLDLIQRFPFDHRLYLALGNLLEQEEGFAQAATVLEIGVKMRPEPETVLALRRNAARSGNAVLERQAANLLDSFARPFHAYVNLAEERRRWCADIGLQDLAGRYAAWLDDKDVIFQKSYRPFMKVLRELRMAEISAAGSGGSSGGFARPAAGKRPLISVVIPAYNYAGFLPYTLENVLAEQGVQLDVIVVDDGSTDGTAEAASSFGSSLRYIRQENQGLSAARNTGLRAAQGDFLVFLDADDLLYPGTLRSQAAALERRPEANLAVCHSQLFQGDEPSGPFAPGGYFPLAKDSFAIHFCSTNIAPVHAFMARRELVDRAGFFDAALRAAEDYDFWLRCMERGAVMAVNDDGLALYRQHGRNMSGQSERQLACECLLRGRVEKLLLNSETFAAGYKLNGWLAHAARCFALAIDLAACDGAAASGQAEAGAAAIGKIAGEAAAGGGLYAAEAAIVTGSYALSCMYYLDCLRAKGAEDLERIQEILRSLFPQTALPQAERLRLYGELLAGRSCPNLYLSNFTDWKLSRRAVGDGVK